MNNFYTYQLIKLVYIIFSLNNTFVQSVEPIFKKSDNDDINLYSNFNKRLSTISNYAKAHMDEVSKPYLDQLFKTNNEIITEMNNKRKEKMQPKKIHKYYDQFDNFNDEMDNGATDDETVVINNDLRRLISILGKGKHKTDDNEDKDEDTMIRVSDDLEPNGSQDPEDEDDDSDNIDGANNGATNIDETNDDSKVIVEHRPIEDPMIDVQLGKPLLKPVLQPVSLFAPERGGPSDEEVANWVHHNPEKFKTFVHAMYVMRNHDNKKIKNEISCLMYCDHIKPRSGFVTDVNGKRCICPSTKKRRQTSNNNLIENTDVSSPLSNHDIVRKTKDVSTSSSSSSPSSSPTNQETRNPFRSSGNLLNIYENNNNNKNNNNEDKNQMDETIFNGNLIDSPKTTITTITQRRDIPAKPQTIVETVKPVQRVPKCDACSQLLDNQCNATIVLDRVLEELDVLKEEREKLDLNCSDGKPCNITGAWNSQVIGMQFNINTTCGGEHELLVTVAEHYPPKRACMMDTNWTLVGYALHLNGGPFYMAATRSKLEVLATFTGMCRVCTGAETIFGTWNFIRPAKDCRDLLMAVDVKRDIFHKSTLHDKVIEKKKKILEKKQAEEANT